MPKTLPSALIAALLAGAALAGCNGRSKLQTVADLGDRQVTGVTVSAEGRIFVCFPRWDRNHDLSVAEVLDDGRLRPYPNEQWNHWDTDEDPRDRFVCVQSVYADTSLPGSPLWILDPASPLMEGVVTNGPKLVQVDLATNRVIRTIRFDAEIAPPGSYLNDVRVDNQRGFAYITDSGLGALVVVNLNNQRCRRVLEDHPSTQADTQVTPVVGGRTLHATDGTIPQIHADGLALSRDGEYVYFQPLTSRTLYRIAAAGLRNFSLPDSLLNESVETLGPSFVCDGMIADARDALYLTALEHNAILRRRTDSTVETVVADEALAWPDSLAISPEGDLYVTVSQIHLSARFSDGRNRRTQPYRLYRIPAAAVPWPAPAEE